MERGIWWSCRICLFPDNCDDFDPRMPDFTECFCDCQLRDHVPQDIAQAYLEMHSYGNKLGYDEDHSHFSKKNNRSKQKRAPFAKVVEQTLPWIYDEEEKKKEEEVKEGDERPFPYFTDLEACVELHRLTIMVTEESKRENSERRDEEKRRKMEKKRQKMAGKWRSIYMRRKAELKMEKVQI